VRTGQSSGFVGHATARRALADPVWAIPGRREVAPCPLYPRKRTCAVQLGMSVWAEKRKFHYDWHVRTGSGVAIIRILQQPGI
jgi:hypothetical protein